LELTPCAERGSFLARRLDDDPALLSEATAMLRAHEDSLESDKKLLNRGSARATRDQADQAVAADYRAG